MEVVWSLSAREQPKKVLGEVLAWEGRDFDLRWVAANMGMGAKSRRKKKDRHGNEEKDKRNIRKEKQEKGS